MKKLLSYMPLAIGLSIIFYSEVVFNKGYGLVATLLILLGSVIGSRTVVLLRKNGE